MQELLQNPFYKLIETYKNCIIDYCLISSNEPHEGIGSHREAVRFAMQQVTERYNEQVLETESGREEEEACEPFSWSIEMEKAQAHLIDASILLSVPKTVGKDCAGRHICDAEIPNPTKGGQIPYWYAFWQTPHVSGYGPEDFLKVNAALFPEGTDSLEVYEWTTDWSDYFDDGHEWWGAACWSIYDRSMERYVVIMASTTD